MNTQIPSSERGVSSADPCFGPFPAPVLSSRRTPDTDAETEGHITDPTGSSASAPVSSERRVRRVRGPELLSINPGVIPAHLEPKCAVHGVAEDRGVRRPGGGGGPGR
jgi:hypothetical protein